MTPSAKATRAAVKGHITRIVQAITGYESLTMSARISTILIEQEKRLKEKFDTYKSLSLKIQDDMGTLQATQQEYDTEYDTIYQTEEEVSAARVIQIQNIAAIQQLMATTPAQAAQSTRLPQRQIKPFKGDILEWTPFWESFNAAIHSSSLQAVQKFDYLKEYLKGEAYLFVENLELTDANYAIAIDELKKTYGQKDVLIDAHLNKSDTLQPVKDANDFAALKIFYLNVQSHINALETLGVARNTFGRLLGSRLIKLVPHKLQAKLAESSANVSTNIDGVIKFIREQVEAAERLNRLKPKYPTTPPPQRHVVPTPAIASQLAAGAKQHPAPNSKQYYQAKTSYPQSQGARSTTECNRPCIFCGEIHWASNCPKTLKERKNIIQTLKRCTNCFGDKHDVSSCTSTRNCNRCNARHHTALCDKREFRFSKEITSSPNHTVAGNSISATSACASTFGQLMLKTA
ncbi:hypothetical protein GHT06_011537 [Daphnia sinensis]|uniref:Uncharacterized protein n=1 Tax=Daphnia sinensis TaxID=1820382 RepID=A0AAD5KVX9_9CRUS|nr:hypothetical protein GHT06_011537 [Daphnia sinensis]